MTGQSALLLPPDQAVATISATIVEELQPALERLEEFTTLLDDWDSYGAAPISDIAIDTARELAAEIVSKHALSIRPADYTFDVVPLPEGGVQLEWSVEGRHLEISVGRDGTLGYLLVPNAAEVSGTETGEAITRPVVLQIADSMLRDQDE